MRVYWGYATRGDVGIDAALDSLDPGNFLLGAFGIGTLDALEGGDRSVQVASIR
jgi:hypothetical protein